MVTRTLLIVTLYIYYIFLLLVFDELLELEMYSYFREGFID